MDFKSFHENNVSILHFPGKQKKTYAKEIDMMKEIEFTMPEDLSIISIMTPDVVESSPLHYQLTKNNVSYINTVPADHKMWINRHKPRYVKKALELVRTNYCLILDGNDVVIVDNLDDIIEKFNCYERDIIYNATSNRFPNLEVDKIPGIKDDQRIMMFGPFCFLNAGVCIGKTEALRWFYDEVIEAVEKENIPSEQYFVRKVMNNHQDKVFFDYDCRLFQAFNAGTTLTLNGMKDETSEEETTNIVEFKEVDNNEQ